VFAKLFGWRKKSDAESYDPPEVVVPVRPRSVKPAPKAISPEKKVAGFDPYNSGAFHRHNAWERVPRR
jgi:hypothetical protein